MRSASSITRISTVDGSNQSFLKNSSSRPGVATVIVPVCSRCISRPPMIVADVYGASGIALINEEATSATCTASSLVGSRTRTLTPKVFSKVKRRAKAGNKKAALLPVPVGAPPKISCPSRALGITKV